MRNEQNLYEALRDSGFSSSYARLVILQIKKEEEVPNLFENNEPFKTHDELSSMSDGPYVVLPPLADGYRYELVQISDGSYGVVVKK